MDASTEARRAARRLLEGPPSIGERERAAQLLELGGEAEAAADAWRQAGALGESAARLALDRQDPSEAVQAFYDAAQAFARGKDVAAAKRAADLALSHWDSFVAAKRIDIEPAAVPAAEPPKGQRLRRLPGARGVEAAPARGAAPAADPQLPAMFLEMRAKLLADAGRAKEAESAYESLLEEIGREVARRRSEQQWQEALESARGWLQAALRAGGRMRLDQVRPEFVSLAREAAAEAATPEYFVRGHDEVPARAMRDALIEAHALGNEAFAAKYDGEFTLVLERTARLLDALTSRRLAAEALLADEHQWPMIAARAGARKRLVEISDNTRDFVGNLGASGVAATHPLRAELEEFGQRLDEAVERASRRAPLAYAEAARATVPSDPELSQSLATRGLELVGPKAGHARVDLLRSKRAALVAAGKTDEANRVHGEVMAGLGPFETDAEEELVRHLEDDRFAAERDPAPARARALEMARTALARHLVSRAAEQLQRGERRAAFEDFTRAAGLGDDEARRWLQVEGLSSAP